MKISVSNIAWGPGELEGHLKLLKDLGCDGIEIAPSCIWPEPLDSSKDDRVNLRRIINDKDLEVVSIHALLYTRPDLRLFSKDGFKDTLEYIKGLIHVCSDLGGRIMVFGSPRNRDKGERSLEECFSIATEFFYLAAVEAGKYDVFVCIEPLGQDECNFITSSLEASKLIKSVNHPNFRLHLDIKAMISSNEIFDEVFPKYLNILQHVHIGDPGLTPPGYTGFDHNISGSALKKSGYNKYISIEMRRGFGPSPQTVAESVKYVKKCYME